jgi:hypothetical protein
MLSLVPLPGNAQFMKSIDGSSVRLDSRAQGRKRFSAEDGAAATLMSLPQRFKISLAA